MERRENRGSSNKFASVVPLAVEWNDDVLSAYSIYLKNVLLESVQSQDWLKIHLVLDPYFGAGLAYDSCRSIYLRGQHTSISS